MDYDAKQATRHRASMAAHAIKMIMVDEVCIVKYVQMKLTKQDHQYIHKITERPIHAQ
jgi:hypothetical protein